MPKKKVQNKKTKKSRSLPKEKRIKDNYLDEQTEQLVKLPNVLKITKDSWLVIWNNRFIFLKIAFVYELTYLILVLGLSSPSNVSSLKKEFSGVFHGQLSSIYSGLSIFTYLIGSSTSSATPAGSAYQGFILIIASLSIIWTLRQLYMKSNIRARDSFYKGLYPLIQYILVLLFIGLELLPLIGGLGLYGLLINGGIAVTALEKIISIALIIALIVVSLYLISSSVIALYIVTLPDMTPLKALRSAKRLVKNQRWTILRKIIFLPVLLLIAIGLVMLFLILAIPAIAAWVFVILSLSSLIYAHSYLYNLYRGLINEQSSS
jgi:hypothetical protein